MNKNFNHIQRAAMMLLMMLLTTATAGADDHVIGRVIIDLAEHGTITVTRNDNNTTVNSGDVLPTGTTVTVNATPDDGYDLKELRLNIDSYEYVPFLKDWDWATDGASLISNGATFTIEENKEYTFMAQFDQNVVKYSISKNITGPGTLDVTSESVAGNSISVGYSPSQLPPLLSLQA